MANESFERTPFFEFDKGFGLLSIDSDFLFLRFLAGLGLESKNPVYDFEGANDCLIPGFI